MIDISFVPFAYSKFQSKYECRMNSRFHFQLNSTYTATISTLNLFLQQLSDITCHIFCSKWSSSLRKVYVSMYNQKRRLPFHIFRSQKQRIKPNGEGTQSKAIYHRNRSMVSTNAVGYIDTVIKDGWGTLLLNQINGRLQFDLFSYYQHCTFCIFQIGTQVSKQFLFCSHFLMFEF